MEGMNVRELVSKEDLQKWVSERKVEDILDTLLGVGVPVAPINSLKGVVEDPHVMHRDMIVSLEHPIAGTVRSPNHPIKYSDIEIEMRYAAPLLGQHNEVILSEVLDYSPERIRALRESKVIS